ncbi:hypothetical protein Rsub_07034 [Raphidocelis subcapitata]|uniref:Uncharacterized protein n=1 Tax=Raphidocelis subcapitata TaxID=307507 RepID=A0A2V0P9G8_9CHLO|nr:hypothetical protein Rsub_07034 [Raphidocelis subcapitata]|eukprot:GBF94500.1 hypothetical protein Rsub_07034 [Raphidocelis subcapitata]
MARLFAAAAAAALLLLALARPAAAQDATRNAVAEQFVSHCQEMGAEGCAYYTVAALYDADVANVQGGGECAVTDKHYDSTAGLSRDVATWAAFYKQVFTPACTDDAACVEAAYKSVGAANSADGANKVFFEVPACAMLCNSDNAQACGGGDCNAALGFGECRLKSA